MKSKLLFYFLLCTFYFISCSPNNVTIDNGLKKYFDHNKVSGCFALYDNGQNQFTVYNLTRYRDSSYLPASTFEIVSSLTGLEKGVISNEKMVIPWDGLIREYPNGDTAKEWNKDLSMQEAFAVSAIPYYQQIARRIGKDTMQFWLDSLHYGTHKITSNIDTFWLDNSLKISADEELGLVKKLYFGQLPFQKRTQQIVKKIMLREDSAKYKLSYKTGWGFRENGNAIGWLAGWIEENQHPYFFVLNVEGAHDVDILSVRANIIKAILKSEGFFQGRK